MILTQKRRKVLAYAKHESKVWEWPPRFKDKDIRDCRIAGWLEVAEHSINMAQENFYGGQEDHLTEAGKKKIEIVRR